jgi:hypothetical protein
MAQAELGRTGGGTVTIETMTLTDFLHDRIAEDEAMARKVQAYCEPHGRIEINLSRSETLPDGSRRGTHETPAERVAGSHVHPVEGHQRLPRLLV